MSESIPKQSEKKKYLVGTPEVAKMFGISYEPDKSSLLAVQAEQLDSLPVSEQAGFTADAQIAQAKNRKGSGDEHKLRAAENQTAENFEILNLGEARPRSIFFKIAKAVLPYIAVFTVGLVLYYFFFANLDFGKFFQSRPKAPQTKKDSFAQNFQKQNLENYRAWISQFYFDVSDQKVLDPDSDNSGNGLTNFQKYLLNLNPKAYDTLGLGLADSEALADGINPLSGNQLTAEQKQIVEKYIDMEIVMNRLTLAQLSNKNRVAGRSEINPEASGKCGLTPRSAMSEVFMPCARANEPDIQPINQPLGGQSNNQSSAEKPKNQQPKYAAPATGPVSQPPFAKASGGQPIFDNPYNLDTDTAVAGRLEIPDLGVNAPIIWTKNPKNFNSDLKSGVVHYPGTALPGQIGTAYISGHSSNFAWAKGKYNQVFSKLGDLPDNTSFKITLPQKNGRDAILHYVVTHRKEFKPTDQAQFKNSAKSIAALSTCWPVGTTQKRLVVFGELTQVEQ